MPSCMCVILCAWRCMCMILCAWRCMCMTLCAWCCMRAQAGGTTKDKRNLYLAKEGEIKQGTPAWNGMSDHDK